MKRLTKEEYLSSLTVNELTVTNLPDTIYSAYIKGTEEADMLYRKAICKAFKKYNIPITPTLNAIYNYINHPELMELP